MSSSGSVVVLLSPRALLAVLELVLTHVADYGFGRTEASRLVLHRRDRVGILEVRVAFQGAGREQLTRRPDQQAGPAGDALIGETRDVHHIGLPYVGERLGVFDQGFTDRVTQQDITAGI